jgi:hypothetical protein
MHGYVKFTGEIGPFLDTVQQRQVSVVVAGGCKYSVMNAPGDQAQIEQQVQTQMLRAIHETIAPKMASEQISFSHMIEGTTGPLIPEIFARSGLSQAGIAVDKLAMHFGIDGRPPKPIEGPAAPAPSPIAPQQANLRVGGFNVHASTDGGIDTAGLKNQLVAKAKSTIMWWLMGIVIVVIVLGSVGAYGYYAYKHPPAGAGAAQPAAAKAPEKAHPGKK